MNRWSVGFAAVALLATASCGGRGGNNGGATGTSVAPAVGSGWLASSATSVDFVQWTDSGGALSGSAQTVAEKGQPPNLTTATNTLALSGTLHGSTLSVSFEGAAATFGTISGDSFTLNVPQTDGTLAPVAFHKAPTSAFNSAVVDLNSSVSAANARAAGSQALANQQAASAQAQRSAQQRVDNDVSTVNSDIASLTQQQSSINTSVESIASGSLHGVAVDLAAVHSAEQKVIAEAQQYPDGNGGGVCGDASGVAGDASGVAGDASGVEGDASGVAGNVASLRSAVSGLGQDFAQFQADEGAVADYQPAGLPTKSAVSKATTASDSAISSAVSTTNGYIDQANTEVKTAYQYAALANQAGHCGPDPTPPSPQTHVS